MLYHRRLVTSQRSAGGSSLRLRLFRSLPILICGVLITVAVTPAAVAQVFPTTATQIFWEDFEAPLSTSQGITWNNTTQWWQWQQWEGGSSWIAKFFVYTIEPTWGDNVPYSMWGDQHALALYGSPTNSVLHVIRDSIPPSDPTDGAENANPGNYDPTEWTNIRYEVDVAWDQLGLPGLVWGLSSTVDTNFSPADRKPADGYIFYITPDSSTGFTGSTANCVLPAYQSTWHLARMKGWDRLGNISGQQDWVELASGAVVPKEPGTSTPATLGTGSLQCLRTGRAFRFRLDYFCGNLRVQYLMPWGDTPGVDTLYYGCASAAEPTGICTSANIDDCWCEILEGPLDGIDPSPITDPGMVGFYRSQLWTFLSPDWDYKHDNVKISTFPGDCGLVCGSWSGWQNERTDVIPFKKLYEGALFDFSAGRHITPSPDLGKIDVKTEAPASVSSYNHSADSNPYCNGWNLLEDLPGPTGTTNVEDIKRFLEPMTSAVKYESSGGTFSWVDDFDNDPASATYNPLPMVADGSTPINSSLLEAFDWYVAQRTTGAWATDPYEGCRQWYVILITDGEEACEPGNPGAVCDAGGAAEKFANPGVVGVDPLPVYTIGFSEGVSDDSPLKCIAEDTGGLFLTAENASQLSDALYEVFYRLEGETRSFAPFKIAPPPSSSTGNPTRDYLAVYPLFQPVDGQTLWAGNLWAFPLNRDQPTVPTTGDCEIDTSQLAWNAYDALEAQIDAHTEGNPKRFVFMGSDASGSWARHDLATIPTDATLRAEFKTLLDVSGGVTDVVAQQIVNFVRDIRVDNDSDPSNAGPPALARPSGYPVLGDFFHSQPVVVNPPNSSIYFFNYGYGAANEVGAHDYGTFMDEQAKRRRIVLAGANDGMLHAFDGGVWDRDRAGTGETYDEIHDLGNGTELFAWVPQAVMDNLYNITSGGSLVHTTGLDMVDGPIVRGDAFIDSDGDSDREWRTVALTSMRRGGRGILALDITQPDPTGSAPDYVPAVSEFPGCLDGSTADCSGEYPRVMWEFSDTADADANGIADLGWTWSKPAIARIAVYNSSDPAHPDDVFVAFFGGGWDKNEADSTGKFFYAVDLETGAVLLKTNMSVDLPGGITALDSDVDGFHDRIYFGDSNGGVHRLQFPSPTSASATGAAAGTMTRIFDFSSDFPDRQEFFTSPTPVPALFSGSGYTWALAFGSGDRASLDRDDSGIDHFFFLLDAGDTTTRGAADLVALDYTALDGSFDCAASALDPAGGDYGWYLSLRDTEKTVNDALVINGYVFFPTFDPSTETATNPPNACEGSGGGGAEPPVELSVVCRASGIGRAYKLWYECGLGEYTEYNDIITGLGPNGAGDTTKVQPAGTKKDDPPPPLETGLTREHTVTNWRQE